MKHYTRYSPQAVEAPAPPAIDDLLAAFDTMTAKYLENTTSAEIPKVLAGARAELTRLVEKEGNDKSAFADYAYVIERTWVAAVRCAMLPTDLQGPVVFARKAKRENGAGSRDKPHFREIGQVRKAAGRFATVVELKRWAAAVYLSLCSYLGIEKPEELEIDMEMVRLIEVLWDGQAKDLRFDG